MKTEVEQLSFEEMIEEQRRYWEKTWERNKLNGKNANESILKHIEVYLSDAPYWGVGNSIKDGKLFECDYNMLVYLGLRQVAQNHGIDITQHDERVRNLCEGIKDTPEGKKILESLI